jgi:acetolactate synthase-1/2/3 large subunit
MHNLQAVPSCPPLSADSSNDSPDVKLFPVTENTYADMIVDYLARINIEVVFGVPGGAIEPFLNALARSERRGGPRLVVARHECGAAFMADGYYRATGKMGVVCATTGPGATNLITGVSSALADNIPMLVITGQTPLPKFGKLALQESSCTAIDTVGMFRYCTRFNSLVSHHEQLESKLIAAIMAAHRTPHGPAHISIPSDVLRTPATIKPHIHADLLVQEFLAVDTRAVNTLCEKLAKVDAIVVYVGKGVGKAHQKVMDFINLTGAGFVTGPSGKGWVDETHPQYHGVFGFAGHESARELFQDNKVDLIIAIGAELEELGTSGWDNELLNTKLIHIDSSVEHFTRSPMANLHVFGELSSIFDRLNESVKTARSWGREWSKLIVLGERNALGSYVSLREEEKCFSVETPIKPQRLMYTLSQKLPEETQVFIDAGNAWSWTTHYLISRNCDGRCHFGMGFGSMTWAIGGAIGAALGSPETPTVCIVGDGSYLMSAQEITVAVQQHLPVVFIVLNDSALGMVQHGQQLGKQESIGWQLNEVDFAAMAKTMGAASQVINSPQDLNEVNFKKLFNRSGPTLLDVRIDRNEVPPMGDRIKGLAVNASATPGG